MNSSLVVSLSPHVRGKDSVASVMWGVVIALLPAVGVSVWAFGLRALIVLMVAVGGAVLTEWLVTALLLRRPVRVADGSAAVTGLLLGLNLPAGIPLWQVAAGAVFAIAIAKMVFGGLGHNPFNPALAGRAFMLASFPGEMTLWPQQGFSASLAADGVTGATPLGILAESGSAALAEQGAPGHLDLFLGTIGGSLGEISALAILVGGLFMLIRRIITWEIPVMFLLGLGIFTGAFWAADPGQYADPLYHILAGGAMLGAWFMATDMVTSPMTVRGRIIYALAGGMLAGAIRLFGAYPEGVSYAILIMNAFVPIIDRAIKPRRFGVKTGTAPLPMSGPAKSGASGGGVQTGASPKNTEQGTEKEQSRG
ncbi:RnfABCDGE type electron transport complex subunit D [Spirochaeta lutea]|uniref:RnfABCDGE type electron transport complex subunit D n=1 Tax=Spirochaeta lutea TaxID=1480694 RepID=UPI0009DFDDCA|nr:RnfABCDGE type electron transport complex subunit D [Spirochaeta lutea]